MPTSLTSANFNEYINVNSHAIVDFTATWCGPCKRMKPFYEKAESFIKDCTDLKLPFLACDADEEPDILNEYGIEGLPTVVLFKNGERVATGGPFPDDKTILTFIGRHFDVKEKEKPKEQEKENEDQKQSGSDSEASDGRVGYDKDDDYDTKIDEPIKTEDTCDGESDGEGEDRDDDLPDQELADDQYHDEEDKDDEDVTPTNPTKNK